MLSKSIFRQFSRVAFARPALVASSPRSIVFASKRFYSEPSAKDIFESSPSLQKIKSTPEVLQVMMEVAEMMQNKGYVKPGEQPGLKAMMKIMTDSELKALLVKMKTTMDKHGIVLDQNEYVKHLFHS